MQTRVKTVILYDETVVVKMVRALVMAQIIDWDFDVIVESSVETKIIFKRK